MCHFCLNIKLGKKFEFHRFQNVLTIVWTNVKRFRVFAFHQMGHLVFCLWLCLTVSHLGISMLHLQGMLGVALLAFHLASFQSRIKLFAIQRKLKHSHQLKINCSFDRSYKSFIYSILPRGICWGEDPLQSFHDAIFLNFLPIPCYCFSD